MGAISYKTDFNYHWHISWMSASLIVLRSWWCFTLRTSSSVRKFMLGRHPMLTATSFMPDCKGNDVLTLTIWKFYQRKKYEIETIYSFLYLLKKHTNEKLPYLFDLSHQLCDFRSDIEVLICEYNSQTGMVIFWLTPWCSVDVTEAFIFTNLLICCIIFA